MRIRYAGYNSSGNKSNRQYVFGKIYMVIEKKKRSMVVLQE